MLNSTLESTLPSPPESEPERSLLWKPAIATISLGAPDLHSLKAKLDVAAKNGFMGIELFHDDLKEVAGELQCRNEQHELPISSGNDCTQYASEMEAAHLIRDLCNERDLQVISLQPFRNYEGLTCDHERTRRIKEFQHWVQLAAVLGEDVMILIPSSFLDASETTGDRDLLVTDLALAADLAYPVRVAYEALAWGTHVNTWEDSWDIVRRVDRKNFGICLDTFNIAARVWADPTTATGRISQGADQSLKESLERLVHEVDPNRVFCIQLADGERVDPSSPFLHVPGQSKLLGWSRNARLFPFEEERGGYLPILEVAAALVNGLHFRGWVSMEIFSRTTRNEDPTVPAEHATRAARSWNKALRALR